MISPIIAWPSSTEHQVMDGVFGTDIRSLELPSAEAEVLPGVQWGNFDVMFTPAFWAGRMWLLSETNTPSTFRLGSTLAEEVVACLLGGHGLPAAVGLAAYERLKSVGMCAGTPTAGAIEEQLLRPLTVQGRSIRYRFPRQRASFIARALEALASNQLPATDLALRDFLTSLTGIGPKTASWITRNWLGSDRVAIIDIHIQRAGVLAGFFKPAWTPARHYRVLEEHFLAFAEAIGVRASLLDNLMWQEMRVLSRYAGQVDG
jgi:N-glycosylase/DNA lyase